MNRYRHGLTVALVSLAVCTSSAPAAENMIGRQSQNEGVTVVPAPGAVAVDGVLDDWDLSGRIVCFADETVRTRYSAEVAAMWDAEALYISVRWRDPTPMLSTVDPAVNPNDGWKSDSLQMRIRTADRVCWLTTWYYAPKRQPVLHAAVWKDMQNERNGTEDSLHAAPEGGTDLGGGAAMAYRADEDGTGYVQELRVPWSEICETVPEIRAGLTFRLGLEFLWGDPTGSTWPIHRYADNLQPGITSREFFWSARNAWGDAVLAATGVAEPRKYIPDTDRIEGSIPIRAVVPKRAARMTVAIDDADGNRVRNLAGDLRPETCAVAEDGDTRTVEILWDGLDDAGALVSPGTYRVRGLYHEGLGAEYEMCFYNPGTPPWGTRDGTGGWGADHCPPLRVAVSGDLVALSWDFAEGGSGIIGLGPDGRKRWGEKRGARLLAADDAFLYAVPAGWHIDRDVLIRLDRTGAYRPFTQDGRERPFELPFEDILGSAEWKPVALAATADAVVVLLHPVAADGEPQTARIAFLDRESAALLRTADTGPIRSLAAGSDGALYGMSSDGVCRLAADGAMVPIPLPGDVRPAAIAVDRAGNILLADEGPDQQIKAFAPDGRLAYTCGRRGGRPIRGDFDPQALRAVRSLAADAEGYVWAVESWDFPRRVSVWNPADGTLLRDYIGNTGYAGTGCYLHDTNPELAYVGPIELKLDRASRSWQVTRVLWVPDPDAGESFSLSPGEHAQAQRFTAIVNGREGEYLFAPPYRDYHGYTLFMETPRGWQPVSAVTTVGTISGRLGGDGQVIEPPGGEFADCNAYDAVFWNDDNGDGKVQRGECAVVRTDKPGTESRRGGIPIPMGSGWGERITTDFVFYVDGIARCHPIGFSPEGAPRYGPESIEPLPVKDRGDLIPVPEEDLLLCLSWDGYPRATRLVGIDTETGRIRWRYPNPFPGVHGSHGATMPKPGMLIGPLKIAGVVDTGGEAGRVFLMRGNLGQDFLMTTDGLFVGAMFMDGRLPAESLPNREEALVGMPMEAFSHGGEPFNGWFGRQADGRVRMTTGFPRQAAMILGVTGLERIRRFAGSDIALTTAAIEAVDRDNRDRAVRNAPPREYTLHRFAAPPDPDGDAREWERVPALVIDRPGFPFKAKVRLGFDDTSLYALWEVEDPSPWRNGGKDVTRLFKTGDAVDLQFCTDPARFGDESRRDPVPGDVRVLVGSFAGKPVAVLMRPVDPGAAPAAAVEYSSPVGTTHMDRVGALPNAAVGVRTRPDGYTVEAAIPLAELGFVPEPGSRLRGDVGFVSSDPDGTVNTARTYWANKETNLVNDMPQEARLTPHAWGVLILP